MRVRLKRQVNVNVELDSQVENWARAAVNGVMPQIERKYREFADVVREETTAALSELSQRLGGHLAAHELGGGHVS